MVTCSNCGRENPSDARFCMACATPLMPAGSAGSPREIRKTVTVVFCDVTGSTSLGERLDPESMRRVMTRYFEEMRRVLVHHGGTVEKFIGDAIMAVFGIPVLHEDDALRAVRAAWEMREVLATLNEELERHWGVSLHARTGVNTGEVVAPVAGDAEPVPHEHLITGDAVNVAARLEQAAEPDTILLGEQTYRLVRDAVRAKAEEPKPLKGKSAPVSSYRLLEVKPVLEGHQRRLDSPMIGRERQLSMLVQAFHAAVSDRACHLFTVMGSAGVGKSRLIQEFLAAVAADAQVLRGRCLSYGEGITFWPVVEMVKTAVGVTDDLSADDARERMASAVHGDPDATSIGDRLGELLGVGEAPSIPQETFWAVRRLVETLARRRPLVAVFDDIHWAEPTLLDLIEYLADWTKDAPVLLLCSARPELLENRPGWGGGKFNATSILLESLPPDDCAHLIDNLVGAAELPEAVKQRIVDAAEGTPLFVEEMLSMLIDDGLLRRDDGHWVPAGDLSKAEVPPTIQALLAARLDRLRFEERSVVECGSVEGKIFHRGALAELATEPAKAELHTHLMTLTRRELIRPDQSDLAGQEAYRFRHQLIRDAAYQGIPKERRAELHRRFATWLERAVGNMVQEYDEIVGYHLEQAYRYRTQLGPVTTQDEETAVQAADHLGQAGGRAFARGDMPAAANLLQRALDLLQTRPAKGLQLVYPLANALFFSGEYRRCEETLTGAIEEAARAGDRGLEMRLRVELVNMRQQWNPVGYVEEAEEVAAEAIRLFEQTSDHLGLARSWVLVAGKLNMLGHAEGIDDALERAVHHARLAGDRVVERDCLAWLGAALYWGPTPVDQASRRLEEMLAEAEGDRLLEARLKRSLSAVRGMQGRFDEARRLVAESRASFEELGLRLPAATMGFASGPFELWAERPEAAEAALRESCDALQAMGDRSSLCSLAAFLAEALYVQGKDEEAWHYTEVAEQTAGAEDLEAQSDYRSVRAKLLARRGELEEAESMAREAVEIVERTGESDHKGDAHVDLAEVYRMAGKHEDEAESLRRALAWYEAKGNVVMAGKARSLLAKLE